MRTKEINAIVDKAYTALGVLDNLRMTSYRQRCFNMACEEERGHRRGAPNGWQWPKGASVQAAARLFVVKRIAEALTPDARPDAGNRRLTIADILHTQGSAIYAASLVANYRPEILAALEGQDLAALADLDYVQFINDGEKP